MLDPKRLRQFKKQTREDELIAQEILKLIEMSGVQSVLEVGAGPGTIGRILAGHASPDCRLDVIEPNSEFLYPKNVRVIRSHWETCSIKDRYDLLVMSHVVGHFPRENRAELVIRGLENLSTNGQLIIIENAPVDPFWALNLEVAKIQGNQYVVDFSALDQSLQDRCVNWKSEDRVLRLWMGSSTRDILTMINIFFPWEFTKDEEQLIVQWLPKLMPLQDGILDLTQRFYTIRALNC